MSVATVPFGVQLKQFVTIPMKMLGLASGLSDAVGTASLVLVISPGMASANNFVVGPGTGCSWAKGKNGVCECCSESDLALVGGAAPVHGPSNGHGGLR